MATTTKYLLSLQWPYNPDLKLVSVCVFLYSRSIPYEVHSLKIIYILNISDYSVAKVAGMQQMKLLVLHVRSVLVKGFVSWHVGIERGESKNVYDKIQQKYMQRSVRQSKMNKSKCHGAIIHSDCRVFVLGSKWRSLQDSCERQYETLPETTLFHQDDSHFEWCQALAKPGWDVT